MKRTSAPTSAGFTLIELVMVIILIGALSVLGIGLFARSSAFSPLLATQQLASATSLAQQAALAGNPAATLRIEQGASDFVFTVGAGSGNPRVITLPRESTTLSVAGGLPLNLTFNELGAPASGANLSLTFSGDASFQTCLSSLGAVYRGACQP
ncbi:type II secretion system protein [Marinobacter sp. CHS3-4]|uniref:type II secretion system protein n=1 Tax=Marinobacter sp. CHS3-4 TaxID=3045174 RepID=UPI0024B49C40|nr:type II secretion system protein [Marinobacter sp. CHS3-4]MDI9246676.1 type II secretion system protein [Marinobacter sp. CHS3-4]